MLRKRNIWEVYITSNTLILRISYIFTKTWNNILHDGAANSYSRANTEKLLSVARALLTTTIWDVDTDRISEESENLLLAADCDYLSLHPRFISLPSSATEYYYATVNEISTKPLDTIPLRSGDFLQVRNVLYILKVIKIAVRDRYFYQINSPFSYTILACRSRPRSTQNKSIWENALFWFDGMSLLLQRPPGMHSIRTANIFCQKGRLFRNRQHVRRSTYENVVVVLKKGDNFDYISSYTVCWRGKVNRYVLTVTDVGGFKSLVSCSVGEKKS